MRKSQIFILIILLLTSFGFVIAIPNPSVTYCEDMNYTYNDTDCIFDDGTFCELWSFFEGDCGNEYVKELDCVQEGNRTSAATECCEGLERIDNYEEGEGDCELRLLIGGYPICSDCGDDVCDEWENDCSCPLDCEEEEECASEGEYARRPLLDFEEKECCEGLVEIDAGLKYEPDNENADENGCLTLEGAGIKCSDCGNNICEAWEDECSCPLDCEEEEEDNETEGPIKHRNRLGLNQSELPENCTITGSVIRCNIDGGRVMAVMAGQSGNIIVKVRGVNMTTQAELYHHNGKVYGVFGNETKAIEYLPDQIREIVRARIQAQTEGNETIVLNEEGEYEVEVKKIARFLGIFKIKEKVRFHIDPETGEILNVRAPWWSFLTIDVEDEEEPGNETSTNETNSTG